MTQSPAQLVTESRIARGESLRAFAKSLDVSYQTILYWEQGENTPEAQTVASMIASDTHWIRTLGLDLYASQCRRSMEVLYPENGSAK